MVNCCSKHPVAWLLATAFQCALFSPAIAQTCGFSTGKTLHELERSVKSSPPMPFSPNLLRLEKLTFTEAFLPAPAKRGIFLPRWSADDLPFFCKIEHDWAKNRARVPLKFRLGSVDYVDWLEGKSWDKLRY